VKSRAQRIWLIAAMPHCRSLCVSLDGLSFLCATSGAGLIANRHQDTAIAHNAIVAPLNASDFAPGGLAQIGVAAARLAE